MRLDGRAQVIGIDAASPDRWLDFRSTIMLSDNEYNRGGLRGTVG
jgi:hypothetical protein